MKFFKPFPQAQVPVFPRATYNICDYGAVGDGRTVVTDAIRRAITDCSAHGGGRVLVPAGRWLTGPIHWQDNVELHVEAGAIVEFVTDFQAYLPVVYGILAGIRVYSVSHFLYACGCKNIALTGAGTLEGHGEVWWPMKEHQPGMEDLMKKGRARAPLCDRVYDQPQDGVRPRMLQFVECDTVLIEGVTFRNSPSWTVHLAWCENCTVRSVTVENPENSPNTDGINLEYCRRGLVEECTVSGGDDMCCLKAGRNEDAWEAGRPCEDIEIRRCRAINCRGGGVTVGSETSASIRNAWIHDCFFEQVSSGVNLKTMKGRGGVVEDLDIENVQVKRATRDAIRLTMRYAGEPLDDQGAPDTDMPTVRNIYVRNLVCHSTPKAMTVWGVKGHEIQNVIVEDVTVCADRPAELQGVEGLCLTGFNVRQTP